MFMVGFFLFLPPRLGLWMSRAEEEIYEEEQREHEVEEERGRKLNEVG